MASESFPVQGTPSAPVTAPVGSEQAEPIHSVLNTSHTDSEPVTLEKAKAAADTDSLGASRELTGAQPPVADHPLGGVAASEGQGSVEAADAIPIGQKKEEPTPEWSKPAPEPNIGEKRDINSTAAPIAASVSDDKDEPVIEKPGEPDAKKQKTESEPVKEPTHQPAKDTNGTAPAPATGDTNGEPKKAARPKKEKVKDAVKKVIPGDGIGSRTRSRTKPT
ncbi:hypothetical protein N7448_006973 [Penicillium atrosanguineum]|uniref:Uncharacterized protein n=1 Tax=Penicillium atrosanguineum TaxID=1132637 RepID=A0A9W9L3H1_9EURO|nr:uncharacterized protein N7443_010734 [Penicillium atrosanguineum]KAJ5132815.1 hypothetical protein N7448_006973 [Penicillium atrosanguineum]KAJ5141296.1 hypothetical protein N7526_002291 [Penicillium atrosanguineum]KAJ5290481.1 hypothetical protein N7443_010734 [Penicillium atrosanguineum]KAJ5308303.1 hypothetical protein N7476_008959 [Penicillium atrosanguineum]